MWLTIFKFKQFNFSKTIKLIKIFCSYHVHCTFRFVTKYFLFCGLFKNIFLRSIFECVIFFLLILLFLCAKIKLKIFYSFNKYIIIKLVSILSIYHFWGNMRGYFMHIIRSGLSDHETPRVFQLWFNSGYGLKNENLH